MLDSIRLRLTAWHVVVVGVLMLTFCVSVLGLLARSLFERADAVMESEMEATLAMMSKELKETGIEHRAPADTLKALHFPEQAFAIFDEGGQLLAEKPPGAGRIASLPPNTALAEGVLHRSTRRGADGELRRAVALRAPFPLHGRTFQIVISQSLGPLMRELTDVREVLYIAVPGVLMLAGFAGWLLARKSLAPVVAMAEQARRIGAGTLDERLRTTNPRDELGRLAGTFNELLDRLGAAFAQQRQFMADASHELRTPVSVIRTASSVALRREQRSEEDYRGVLQMIDEQARQLGRIVEDMFRLARADAGSLRLQIGPFHLDELLAEIRRDARVLGAEKGVAIEMPLLPEAPFEGDEDLMRQMIVNLVHNAIKFTPAGGRVRLDLERSGQQYTITVADTGIGIPKADQPRIFERFYRVVDAQGVDGREGPRGAGLGLSIARWIADAHHGRVELRHSDPHGSTFAAVLPVPETPRSEETGGSAEAARAPDRIHRAADA
jgi:heavy metal sensor kinase